MTPRKYVPYVVALFLAGMIIAGGWLFVGWTHKSMQQHFEIYKKGLLDMKKAGTLPAEWQGKDIENLQAAEVQMQLPPQAQTYLDVADWLTTNALAVILATVLFCVLSAWAFSRRYTRNLS
jgi:hypothetical protein